MKKFIKLTIIFFYFYFNSQSAFSIEKFAFLNIDLVFQKSITGKKISKKLDDFKKEKLNILKLKEVSILKNEKLILSQKNILSKEEYQNKINELKKEISKFRENKDKISIEFENKRNDELKLFMQKIKPLIEEYITKNSISMVFNQKNLFIADKKYDITNQIIEIIDKDS